MPSSEPYAKITKVGWFTWQVRVYAGIGELYCGTYWGERRARRLAEDRLLAYRRLAARPPVVYRYDANGWRRWDMETGEEL